jgi:hypothetical protein
VVATTAAGARAGGAVVDHHSGHRRMEEETKYFHDMEFLFYGQSQMYLHNGWE